MNKKNSKEKRNELLRRYVLARRIASLIISFSRRLENDDRGLIPKELSKAMAQNIVVQVGQCGSQIGCRFWDLALREHASLMSPTNAKKCIYDASLSAFFRNVDETKSTSLPYPSPLRTLKARAVLVDMEEGVLRSILASPLRDLFDGEQFIRDVSGAGNNWAVGNRFYGGKYRNVLSEEIRRQAEQCDSLQSFMLIHSMVSQRSPGRW